MIKKVLENYLGLVEEVNFFIPYASLLAEKGFRDIRIVHGPTEFGKDIIAKKSIEGRLTQCIFQLKAGNINQGSFREIREQLLEAATSELSHPSLDTSLPRKVFFVLTGQLKGNARLAFQEFNKTTIKAQFKKEEIAVIEKSDLVSDFCEYGFEPFLIESSDLDAIGDFYLLYSKIRKKEPLGFVAIKEYSDRWLTVSESSPMRFIQVVCEAFVFAQLLVKDKRYYEAILFISALVRFLDKNNLYTEYEAHVIDVLKDISTKATESLKGLKKEEGTLLDESTGMFAIFDYPKMCLRVLEVFSLIILVSDGVPKEAASVIEDVIQKEKGWERPLSDNYAVAVALTGLALIKCDKPELLKKLIVNVTVWLCGRYDDLGIAEFGASEQQEYEQLLSECLEGLEHSRRNDSYVATVLLDLAYLSGDEGLYKDISNELRASSIILSRYHVFEDADLYDYVGPSSHDPEYSKKRVERYCNGIGVEIDRGRITKRSKSLFFLMQLLRDRMFSTFIMELVKPVGKTEP